MGNFSGLIVVSVLGSGIRNSDSGVGSATHLAENCFLWRLEKYTDEEDEYGIERFRSTWRLAK